MKALAQVSFFLALGVLTSACSTSSNISKTQEYDDMYFVADDRQPAYVVTAEYNDQTSFNDEYVEPLSEEKIDEFQDVNYSSKTINPEYIEKYSSEAFSKEESDEQDEEVEYFDESYTQYDTNDGYEKYLNDEEAKYNPTQYSSQGFNPAMGFGTSWMYGNSFYNPSVPFANPYAYDTFGRPLRGLPYSYGYNRAMSFSAGYSMGYGSPYYGTYGYSPYGYYDPFYYNDPWGTGLNSGINVGIGLGFGSGGYYCPPNGYSGTGFNSTPVAAYSENPIRKQTYGARSSGSNNATASSQRNQYRSGNSVQTGDQTKVELPRGDRTKSSEQSNYYRRSRNSGSQTYASSTTNDRSYQRYRRSTTASTVGTSTSRTGSSPSTYRTSSGRSTSSSSNQYRTYDRSSSGSGFGTRSSGSSNNSYRSSGSRSNASFNSGSRSTPSRSSGYRSSGSSGRSSGATRSTSAVRRKN